MIIIDIAVWGHIVVGAIGLLAFWIPVFARKGGVNHVRFGNIFKWSAYIAMSFAGLIVCTRIGLLLIAGERPWTTPDHFSFSLFLGYLAITTFMSVHHAIGVLHTKKNPDALRTPFRIFVAVSAIVSSVLLIAFALLFKPQAQIVLFALSPIGIFTGLGVLRYLNGNRISRQAWLYEHLGNMLGAGIAFHTAFAVFGMNRFVDLSGYGALQILPWVLPSIIGIPAIFLWRRKYMKKFGNLEKATA